MTTNAPAEKPSENPVAAIEPGFEVAAQAFWEKNRSLILAVCALALLAVIGREGWQYFAAQHEQSLQADFARAGDRPEQLTAFAAANAGHPLAGAAYLRVADAKYAAGDFRAAADHYTKAAADLKSVAFLGRARIGAALSQLNGGDKAAATTTLKAIAADAALLKATRAEATYHLAALAYEAGNKAEVDRLVGEVAKLDVSGLWAERAASLQLAK
jgi:hypothetical protein